MTTSGRRSSRGSSARHHRRRPPHGDHALSRCPALAPFPALGPHGNPLLEPTEFHPTFVTGACDLEEVEWSRVTREMLMASQKPFLITGLTSNWSAHANWGREDILRLHADEPFQLHATSNSTLGKLLEWNGKYHMGHATYPPGSCYSDPWRPYSPMLFGALADDYWLPTWLGPMVTFQMGVGTGYGIGVPPENHPSSWFAVIKGRKRWVLRPPNAGSSRNGQKGTEPPGVMDHRWGMKGLCAPKNSKMSPGDTVGSFSIALGSVLVVACSLSREMLVIQVDVREYQTMFC